METVITETGLVSITPEAQELIAFAHTFLGSAQAVRITTPEEAQAAVDQTRSIKECAKAIEETRKSFTVPLDEKKKAFMEAFRPAVDVLAKAEQLLKGAITTFQQEEQRRAAALEADRRRAEEDERKRLAEEQKKADQLLQQADEAMASGDLAAVEALEEQAAAIQTTTVFVAYPAPIVAEKPKGAAVRKIWKARVIDAALVPEQFKIVNEKALDAYAKSMKESAKLPGVEFFSEDSLAIR